MNTICNTSTSNFFNHVALKLLKHRRSVNRITRPSQLGFKPGRFERRTCGFIKCWMMTHSTSKQVLLDSDMLCDGNSNTPPLVGFSNIVGTSTLLRCSHISSLGVHICFYFYVTVYVEIISLKLNATSISSCSNMC